MAPKEPNDNDDSSAEDDLDELLERLTIDPENYTDAEAEAFDEVLARVAARLPPVKVSKPLPPDLDALYQEIRDVAMMRASFVPDKAPVPFDGYEAYAVRRGGMGLVIQARDPTLDRWVAIKLWIKGGPEAQEALLTEARTLAKFSHPNVVAVHGTGHWRDRIYFVMEWVDGVDGHQWLEDPRPWHEVRDAFVFAGEGLAAAHEAGIQHRDFKPANMLLGADGRVLVADFGVADSLDSAEDDEEHIVGTPCYMAPERLRGGRGDARSDQYSFCVALWRGLYGLRPFAGDTRSKVLAEIDTGMLRVDPEADVPEWLADVVRRGLAVDPDERFPNMVELVDALLEEPGEASSVGDDQWTAEPRSEAGRRLLNAPGWLGFVGGVVVVLLANLTNRLPEEPEAARKGAAASVPRDEPPRPCAAMDAESATDPVVTEVCRLIRGRNFVAAHMLWDREHQARLAKVTAPSDDLALDRDSLIVAETFIEEAEQTADEGVSAEAAEYGLKWTYKAANPNRPSPRVESLRSRAASLTD